MSSPACSRLALEIVDDREHVRRQALEEKGKLKEDDIEGGECKKRGCEGGKEFITKKWKMSGMVMGGVKSLILIKIFGGWFPGISL